jgi:hypothetical protein
MNNSVTQEITSDDGWFNAKKTSRFFDLSVHTLKVYRERHWSLGIHISIPEFSNYQVQPETNSRLVS